MDESTFLTKAKLVGVISPFGAAGLLSLLAKGAISTTLIAAWPMLAGLAVVSAVIAFNEVKSTQALKDFRSLVDATANPEDQTKKFAGNFSSEGLSSKGMAASTVKLIDKLVSRPK